MAEEILPYSSADMQHGFMGCRLEGHSFNRHSLSLETLDSSASDVNILTFVAEPLK